MSFEDNLDQDQRLLHRSRNEDDPLIDRFEFSPTKLPFDIEVNREVAYEAVTNGSFANSNSGSSGGSKQTIRYPFDNTKFDSVRIMYYLFRIPPVKIRSEYIGKLQISWSFSLPHQIAGSCYMTMKMSDKGMNNEIGNFSFDQTWWDIYYNYFVKNKNDYFRDTHLDSEPLVTWGNELPSYQVKLPLPWFWSNVTHQNLPIHNNSGTITFGGSFTMNVKNQIKSFLRIRILLDDGTYQYVQPSEDISAYITISGDNVSSFAEKKRDISRKAKTEKEERQSRSSQRSSTRLRRTETVETTSIKAIDCLIFTQDSSTPTLFITGIQRDKQFLFSSISSNYIAKYFTYDVKLCCNNEMMPGSTKEFTIPGRELHHAFYIVARNNLSESRNCYSNYSTNSLNPLDGRNPIERIRISVGENVLYDGDTDMLEVIGRNHFPASPDGIGFNAYSLSLNPISSHNDTSHKSTTKIPIKIVVSMKRLKRNEENTGFNVCIYSHVKSQVVHDRSRNTLHVLKDNFKD